ncbi:MAG: hypothetical protein P8J63_02245 [Verrucomicrobiota bacterium]|nr:hypothetical protein [Verrucomicrobiota bacterium]
MTSSTSNSLAGKTYYYIRERVGTGHWPPGTWFVNRKQVVQLYALRELLERFVISIMPRYLADGREFALPHLKD